LKNTSTIPSVNGDYKSLEKRKNEKHLKNKKKKKTKKRIVFNFLLQTTLNRYLKAFIPQTLKIQNQKFPKNEHKDFNGRIWKK